MHTTIHQACLMLAAVLALSATRLTAAEGGLDPSRLPGIVVDDTAAKVEGTWTSSTHTRPYVGDSYLYAQGGAGQLVKFPVEIKTAGTYQVLVAYTPSGNRSTKAMVLIPTPDGDQAVVVNQQNRPAGPLCFQPLGEFSFEAGKIEITVSAEGNEKGVVIADAIQVISPEAFAQYKADFEKNTPKFLAAVTPDPNKKPEPKKPAAKPEAKKPEEAPEELARRSSVKRPPSRWRS